jgi:hypothetical protein
LPEQGGVTLSEAELAGALRYTGNLIVQDWQEGNVSWCALRMAKLLDPLV